MRLLRLRPGSATWESVASQPVPGYVSFSAVKVDGTAQWSLAFTGYSYTSGSTTWNFAAASTAAPVSVVASPIVSVDGKRVRSGRPIPSNPATAGVLYVRKPGKKKWKVYRRVTVTPTGTRFKVKQPAGTRLRFVIPATANLSGWTFQTRITRTRY